MRFGRLATSSGCWGHGQVIHPTLIGVSEHTMTASYESYAHSGFARILFGPTHQMFIFVKDRYMDRIGIIAPILLVGSSQKIRPRLAISVR